MREAQTMRDSLPVLWHLKPSHYNEKVRWALDYKGIAHRRVHPMPGAHMLIALALTRRVATMPVLRLDGGRAIGDSTRIIAALEERWPEPPLYPADPDERRTALALEDHFDETLGPEVRRVGFFELFRAGDFVKKHAAEISTPKQAKAFSSPLFKALTSRRYGVSEESAREGLMRVRSSMRKIEHLLDGGDYLVGGEFTIADLTAAAMLAPLIVPPGLPYRNPAIASPPRLARIESELRAMPAGQWVIRTYERHRCSSSSREVSGISVV